MQTPTLPNRSTIARPTRSTLFPYTTLFRSIVAGGVSLPPGLWLAAAVGAWLMCTRLTLGTTGTMANIDRKSTRLNSSHVKNSYADFCNKKKKKKNNKKKNQGKAIDNSSQEY